MSRSARRHIILCADDYGISPAVSAAIRDLIARRRINATSVMVAAPSFSDAEAIALRNVAADHAAIGLHLTLTAPFRPLTAGFAPLRDGAFLALSAMASRGLARMLTPALIEAEIAAQIAAFRLAFGRAPDYIDGHQHIHVFPQIGEALIRTATRTAPEAWLRQCGRAVRHSLEPKGLILDALSSRFKRLATRSDRRTNSAFAGTYSFRAGADYTRLFPEFLDGLPDGGLVMCHPGRVDAELVRLDPLTDLREREYAYFLDEAFPNFLTERGVGLSLQPGLNEAKSGNGV